MSWHAAFQISFRNTHASSGTSGWVETECVCILEQLWYVFTAYSANRQHPQAAISELSMVQLCRSGVARFVCLATLIREFAHDCEI